MSQKLISYGIVSLFILCLISGTYIVIDNKISAAVPAAPSFNQPISAVFANNKNKLGIAVVSISGPIVMHDANGLFMSDNNPEAIVKKLERLRKRKDVKAIVVRINSPGGSVASVQEIYKKIITIRKNDKKIVIASMADVAASGGYYIAAACDKIVANPGTITGSIGVIMEMGNLSELFKKIGVKLEIIKSGAYKDAGSPHRSLTPLERTLFQGMITDAYDQFVNAIVNGRAMDKAKVLSLATGRIFTGNQALKAGLVDVLGGKEDAIALAAQLAQLPGEPIIIDDKDGFSYLFSLLENKAPSLRLPYGELFTAGAHRRIRLDYMLE
jgi:protease-4